MGYFIKQVWGISASHHGSMHFRQEKDARRLAGDCHRVLLYETGHRTDGSRSIFAVGMIPTAQVSVSSHTSDGVNFDYWLPFFIERELLPSQRDKGVSWSEIGPIIGRQPNPQGQGGLIPLSEGEFHALRLAFMQRVNGLERTKTRAGVTVREPALVGTPGRP